MVSEYKNWKLCPNVCTKNPPLFHRIYYGEHNKSFDCSWFSIGSACKAGSRDDPTCFEQRGARCMSHLSHFFSAKKLHCRWEDVFTDNVIELICRNAAWRSCVLRTKTLKNTFTSRNWSCPTRICFTISALTTCLYAVFTIHCSLHVWSVLD